MAQYHAHLIAVPAAHANLAAHIGEKVVKTSVAILVHSLTLDQASCAHRFAASALTLSIYCSCSVSQKNDSIHSDNFGQSEENLISLLRTIDSTALMGNVHASEAKSNQYATHCASPDIASAHHAIEFLMTQ